MPKQPRFPDAESIDGFLTALGEQLAGGEHHTLVVGGAAALIALGLVDRSTDAIDLLGRVVDGEATWAMPLPKGVSAARRAVAKERGVTRTWLATDASHWHGCSLPAGFLERAERRDYGPALTVVFASRTDQVKLKFLATVGSWDDVHHADLVELAPTKDELLAAARWATARWPDLDYRVEVFEALERVGVYATADDVPVCDTWPLAV